ncbi:MAG: DUF6868 family protein [Methylococcaceae bacterium]
MTIELVTDFLFWCCIINYAVLMIWFLVFKFAHKQIYQLHQHWFELTPVQFDCLHYGGMAFYKLSIFLFNLAPYLALLIIR